MAQLNLLTELLLSIPLSLGNIYLGKAFFSVFYVYYLMTLIELETIFRFNPLNNSYYDDMDGDGVLCMAVDILPTEFAKEVRRLQF